MLPAPSPSRFPHLIILCFFLLLPVIILGQTSNSDGNWYDDATWSEGIPDPSDDVVISHKVTIPSDTIVEINNIEIRSGGHLTIEGTLQVNGSLNMSENDSQFTMGTTANVLIYGDFDTFNKVQLEVSSFLIIYGNFTKHTSSDKGELDVENGNIYIFGHVDEDWSDFDSCGSYEGGTNDIEIEGCDYGVEQDFFDNQKDFPNDLQELISCFEIEELNDISVCENEPLNLTVNAIDNVTYEWQSKAPGEAWQIANRTEDQEFDNTFTTSDYSSGTKYRLMVRPTGDYEGNCKIGISNVVTVSIEPADFELGEISGATEICIGNSGYEYSVPEVETNVTYEWILPDGWTIENGQETNIIEVNPTAQSGEIKVIVISDFCETTHERVLYVNVEVPGRWSGKTNQDWNTASNWECGKVPDSTTDITIPSEVDYFPVIHEGSTGSGKSVTMDTGAELTVTGSLEIHELVESSQALDAKAGTIVFTGNTAQTIPAETFLDDRVKNIIINNEDGVSSQGDLEITGIVKVENGIFHTGDRLSLISGEEQTALIDGSGNGEVEGIVRMQRFLKVAFGYKYFSSPFQNSTVGDFSPYINLEAAFPNFYRYDENREISTPIADTLSVDATGWESYTGSASVLNPMEGYAVNFGDSSDPAMVELTGEVNNGNISKTLTNHHKKYTKGFHLVGNPYPSPIDWNAAAGWSKENIDDAIYFFTASENDQYTGIYRSYIPNGVTSDGETTGSIIPSMQGFFVHVSDNTGGNYPVTGKLGMTNEVRVNDFEQNFYKSAEKQIPLIRLSAGYKNESISDPTVIYFDPFAKTSFDKELDALKLMNTDAKLPDFYSIIPSTGELSINAVDYPLSAKELRLPLGIKAEGSGAMEIRLQDMDNLPSDVYTYLVDLEKRIVQNISKDPVYPFNLEEGKHDSRFELVISRFPLADEAVAFKEPFSVRVSEGRVFVNLNLDLKHEGTVRASTMAGQLLETKEGIGSDILEFQGIRSSGLFIFTLETGSSKYSKKILIKK